MRRRYAAQSRYKNLSLRVSSVLSAQGLIDAHPRRDGALPPSVILNAPHAFAPATSMQDIMSIMELCGFMYCQKPVERALDS